MTAAAARGASLGQLLGMLEAFEKADAEIERAAAQLHALELEKDRRRGRRAPVARLLVRRSWLVRLLVWLGLALTFAACIPDHDPQEQVECYGWSVNGEPFAGQCDLACEEPGDWPRYSMPGCAWDESDPLAFCSATFEWKGVRGCCEFADHATRIEFRECL